MNRIGFWLTPIFVLLYVISSTIYVVDQRQVAVLYSFGQIKNIKSTPGLAFKLPSPIATVSFLDKRTLTLDSPTLNPIQTAERKNLLVDWMVKWRIVDARSFILKNNGTDLLMMERRLTSIVQDAFNSEITRRTVREVVATQREQVMQGVQARLLRDAKDFGIEIVDVRIKRVDFPPSVVESVHERMRSERQQAASQLRATGAAEAEQLRANAERQRDEVMANAYARAQAIKGEADAQAGALYARSFGQDPQFAQFYRNMEAYRHSIGLSGDVLVTDTSNDFFKIMRNRTE